MPTRLPPRKEPRVLALARSAGGLLFASADPWEVRGTGEIKCTERSEKLMVRRLLRREKPTAVTTADKSLAEKAEDAARSTRIPFVSAPSALPPRLIAAELYPELRLFAPRRELERVATLAIATVLHSSTPRRSYAPRCNRTTPRPA
jgi:hypothetical protein